MKAFWKSVVNAWKGIVIALTERNFCIQAFIALVVIIFGLILRTTYIEKMILVLCIGTVLGAEAMNTAVERLANVVSPSHHPEIGIIKDLMAAAVLILTIAAVIVGILIFGRIVF